MDEPADITRHVLRDGDVSVAILSLGCITQDWRVPLNGRAAPVVLGYRDPESYRRNPYYMGAIVGRVANRIAGAGFAVDGRTYRLNANEGRHHLHGGTRGLSTRNWCMERAGARAVELRHVSRDGAEGYPGQASFCVTITLQGHTLRYDMRAEVDRETPISMAQHSYYALGYHGTVQDHDLCIPAQHYTPVDAEMIPTGQIHPLDGAPFDFRAGRCLSEADPQSRGLDMNFVMQGGGQVTLEAPNGMGLRIESDQPGLQLFTAPTLAALHPALDGQVHQPFAGLCLEPQGVPDAVNQPLFPAVFAAPDRPYRQVLEVTIAPRGAA